MSSRAHSIGSSGWVGGGGGNKHEIYMAAFGGHLFMTYLYRAGGHGPSAPLWIRYWLISCNCLSSVEFSNQDTTMQWRIYIVTFWTCAPLGVQILSFSCNFWENLSKSYVGPLSWGVGAPSSGKSLIRHWCVLFQRH